MQNAPYRVDGNARTRVFCPRACARPRASKYYFKQIRSTYSMRLINSLTRSSRQTSGGRIISRICSFGSTLRVRETVLDYTQYVK